MIYPKGLLHFSYKNYIIWSNISNFLESTQMVLSTHSMLSTINIDNNILNISYNYIGKDIIGQIGSLYIINKYSQLIDKNSKKIVKYNLSLQQICYFLEASTPLASINHFIYIASLCNVGKNISFSNLGSVNAKIINSLSIDKTNIGEIYAKINVLNTLSSSMGMCFGLLIMKLIPCHLSRLGLIPVLGILRIKSFNKSLCTLIV